MTTVGTVRRNPILKAVMQSPLGPKINAFNRGKIGIPIDRFLMRAFNFSMHMTCHSAMVGFDPQPMLLLYVIGRKTGREHMLALPFYRVDQGLYIIGSAGGNQKEYHWISNLRATPRGRFSIYRQNIDVQCRFLDDDDPIRNRVWEVVSTKVPTLARQQKGTTRVFPIIAFTEATGKTWDEVLGAIGVSEECRRRVPGIGWGKVILRK